MSINLLRCAGVVAALGSVFLVPGNGALAQRAPVPEQPIYIEQPIHRPTACTLEYRPVCGLRHGRTKTYPNACVAKSEGARVISKDACRHRPVSVRG
jgi:hypothetical protein